MKIDSVVQCKNDDLEMGSSKMKKFVRKTKINKKRKKTSFCEIIEKVLRIIFIHFEWELQKHTHFFSTTTRTNPGYNLKSNLLTLLIRVFVNNFITF